MAHDELFEGMEDAEIYQRGKFMASGFEGVVEVKKTLVKETRKSGHAFIVEMEVLETNMPEQHPVGGKATWFQKLIDKEVALPAIKAWMAACLGFDTHQTDEINEVLAPVDPETGLPMVRSLLKTATDNPSNVIPGKKANEFLGIKLRLSCTQVQTKKGTDFTRYDFEPMRAA